MDVILQFLILFPALLVAIIAHEYMHGYVAYKLGDPTPKYAGRLTLNPLAHIDIFGMFIVPALLLLATKGRIVFGWAKPVPINFRNLRRPRQDMVLVGLAGPLANITLAVMASFLLKAPFIHNNGTIFPLINYFVVINLVLTIFNLIPIPPLDGSRVLMGFLPVKLAYEYMRLEPYGMIILIALLYFGLIGEVVWPLVSFLLKFLTGSGL